MNNDFENLCDQSDAVCDIIILQDLLGKNTAFLGELVGKEVDKFVRIDNVSPRMEEFTLRVIFLVPGSTEEVSAFITLDEELYCKLYGIPYQVEFSIED